jgi:outer membrane protein assembly factor BamA
MNTGGAPPVQARAFLGGEANLRGFNRLEFVGKQVISTRVEYETGFDILGRTGIGMLKALKIQFIPFADAGSTWGNATGVERTTGNLEGSGRSSVGLGIQRDLWLPGARAIRLDIIRRTDGSPDPWSLWFRMVPLPRG